MIATVALYTLLAMALGATITGTLLLIRGAQARPARAWHLRVAHRVDHAPDLIALTLTRAGWARWLPLPRFAPGQSIGVAWPGRSLRRRYSLARWQALPWRYELLIRIEGQGKLTQRLRDAAHPGAVLHIDPPQGDFVLHAPRALAPIVLVAGGVGITPMTAMIDRMCSMARLQRHMNPVHLFWQVRHESEWVYRAELEALARQHRWLHLHWWASRPAQGEGRRLSAQAMADVVPDLQSADVYLCAGPSLLDSVIEGLKALGLPPERIRHERFGLAMGSHPGARSCDVLVNGSACAFDGHPTLLHALEEAGHTLQADCRTGACGQCAMRLSKGSVYYLVAPDAPVPTGVILPCCCVPMEGLELHYG